MKRPLLVAALACLVVGLAIVLALRRGSGPAQRPGDQVPPVRQVRILTAEGGARANGRPLHRGLDLTAPADLDAREGELELELPGGQGRVHLERGARLALDPDAGGSGRSGVRPSFLRATGTLVVELPRGAPPVALGDGAGSLQLYAGRHRIDAGQDAWVVTVERGSALARDASGSISMLLAGQKARVAGGRLVRNLALPAPSAAQRPAPR